MRVLISLVASLAITTTGAVAGGNVDYPSAPETSQMLDLPVEDIDWTGFYVGTGTGSLDYEENGGEFELKFSTYSFLAGYLHDLGRVVFGAEFEYVVVPEDWNPTLISNDSLLTSRGRLGYDAGRILPYVSLGTANYEVSCCPRGDTLTLIGVGVDVQVSDMIRMGVHAERGLNSDADFGFGGFDLETTNIATRVMVSF